MKKAIKPDMETIERLIADIDKPYLEPVRFNLDTRIVNTQVVVFEFIFRNTLEDFTVTITFDGP